MNPSSNDRIRQSENFHILLWLIKDCCWVMDLKWLGMLMILPTISMAFYIAYKSFHQNADFFHNLAICCWILANSVWMTGEFFFNDTLRPYAIIFFVLGLLCVAYFYLFQWRRAR